MKFNYELSSKVKDFLENSILKEIGIGCSDSQVFEIKKNNETDACAYARYKKDIIRIGAIYSLIEKAKLILYSNNGKIKKEIKVVYK